MGTGLAADEMRLDLAALRQQDAVAFEQLYHAFAPRLRRYLLRLCRDPDTADDLLQETFHKAYAALPRLPPAVALRPWLYTIATNTARREARTAYWRRVCAGAHRDLAQPADGAPQLEARVVEADLVERALAAIKPDYAILVRLHWHEGFSIDELCRIECLARDTLKKRLYRAKKAFSAAYAAECATADGKSRS